MNGCEPLISEYLSLSATTRRHPITASIGLVHRTSQNKVFLIIVTDGIANHKAIFQKFTYPNLLEIESSPSPSDDKQIYGK